MINEIIESYVYIKAAVVYQICIFKHPYKVHTCINVNLTLCT